MDGNPYKFLYSAEACTTMSERCFTLSTCVPVPLDPEFAGCYPKVMTGFPNVIQN